MIALEDGWTDVLAKAVRGLGVTPDPTLRALLDGAFDEAAIRRVAPGLGLDAEALIALAAYRPEVAPPAGLAAFSTPYSDFHVNAYLVWDPASRAAIAFDTGSDCQAMLEAARAHELAIGHVLITHTHRDHVMALEALVAATGALVHAPQAEPLPGARAVAPGDVLAAGALRIEARRTTGHSIGGTSYVVTGLACPLAVVGDALFAGSMGRGNVSWADALANNERELFTLPDDTVVCPGHGPLTTIGLERRHNPCYVGRV